MPDALLVVAIVAAAGFCPLMMWWNARRGRASACCPPTRDTAEPATAAELRRRLDELDAQIAEHDAGDRAPAAQPGRTS